MTPNYWCARLKGGWMALSASTFGFRQCVEPNWTRTWLCLSTVGGLLPVGDVEHDSYEDRVRLLNDATRKEVYWTCSAWMGTHPSLGTRRHLGSHSTRCSSASVVPYLYP
jgi:hypothetical protein